jgi:hypothetical protein
MISTARRHSLGGSPKAGANSIANGSRWTFLLPVQAAGAFGNLTSQMFWMAVRRRMPLAADMIWLAGKLALVGFTLSLL